MSFSITIFEKEIQSRLSDTLHEKIAQLPDGRSKQEAEAVADAASDAIRALTEGNGDFGSAYISGSVTEGQNAQLSISVTFQSTEKKRQAEEQQALRAQADAEREAAEKARAAVQAQGPRKADAAKKA